MGLRMKRKKEKKETKRGIIGEFIFEILFFWL